MFIPQTEEAFNLKKLVTWLRTLSVQQIKGIK